MSALKRLPRGFITPEQAAQLLGCHRTTVTDMLRTGRLQGMRHSDAPRSNWMVRRVSVMDLKRQLKESGRKSVKGSPMFPRGQAPLPLDGVQKVPVPASHSGGRKVELPGVTKRHLVTVHLSVNLWDRVRHFADLGLASVDEVTEAALMAYVENLERDERGGNADVQ